MTNKLIIVLLFTLGLCAATLSAFAVDQRDTLTNKATQVQNKQREISEMPTQYSQYIDSQRDFTQAQKINVQLDLFFQSYQAGSIKYQVIYQGAKPDHLLVYLLSSTYHKAKFFRFNINSQFKIRMVNGNYKLSDYDISQQPGMRAQDATCPDEGLKTQFISFMPYKSSEEMQQVTEDVYNRAIDEGYHSKLFLYGDATRDNFLNYMSCPNMVGSFYDGHTDVNQCLVFSDGVICPADMAALPRKLDKVINTWVACQAFSEPMISTLITHKNAHEFVSGINNLKIGPSDDAARCMMESILGSQSTKQSIVNCIAEYDSSTGDQWGYQGHAPDVMSPAMNTKYTLLSK